MSKGIHITVNPECFNKDCEKHYNNNLCYAVGCKKRLETKEEK